MKNGFTLVEILVVMAIVAVMGTIMVVIFTNTLRGSNKAGILSNIKQNGQGVLENMDKAIRGADNIVCPTAAGNTLVIMKNGCYTRFRYSPPPSPQTNPPVNGQIQQDNPQPDPAVPCLVSSPAPSPKDIKSFTASVCADTDPMVNPNILTDTNTSSGVSVEALSGQPVFSRSQSSGYKDSLTVQFALKPGAVASSAVASQIDPVTFKTTVELR